MERKSELDIIKIGATMLIVCHHFQQVLEVKFSGINFFYGRFYFGYLVELFFIISGICALRWIDTIGGGDGFISFYLKRVKRLLPLTAISVIVNVIFRVIYYWHFNRWMSDIVPSFKGVVFACLGMQDGWFIENPMLNNPIWYISVLLLCYIWLYWGIFFTKKIKISPYIFCVLMILLGIGIVTFGIEVPFFNSDAARGYQAFFFGMLLGKMMDFIEVKKMKFQIIAISICVLYSCLLLFKIPIYYEGYIVKFLLWPAVIILCKSKAFYKLLNKLGKQFLKKWDEYAFDTFIWHTLILLLVRVLYEITGWSFIKTYIGMLIVVAFCFAFGCLSHKYISRPVNQMIESLFQKGEDK